MQLLGHPVRRVEDPALLRGEGTFVENLVLAGAAHVVFVRSPIAHARIESIDIGSAVTMPGVIGIYGDADLGLPPVPSELPVFPKAMRRTFLATDTVRYVGEPILAVVAETRAQAVDAVEAVIVDFEALPAVVAVADALGDETLLFPEAGTNTCFTIEAAKDVDFAGCEVIVRQRIVNQKVAPCPIEPRSAVAMWGDDGRLTQWQATQGAHPIRDNLARIYGLDRSQVRVVTPDVGGGFGAKAFPYPEDMMLGAIARLAGRPIRYTESRSESMLGLGHGRAQVQDVEIGGTREGKILAYRLHVLQDAGAYPRFGAYLPTMTKLMLSGTYDIPNSTLSSTAVVTNTVPLVAYRGAGRPEAAAAIERAVDLFAAEIGMDPAEVRRRNVVAADRFPYTNSTGTVYDSGQYEAALDLVLEAAGYTSLRDEQAERRSRGEVVQLGIGLSVYVEVTAGGGGTEYGRVEVGADGRVQVQTGTTPYGQGHRTSWAMLVSERLGIPMDRIDVVHGDTDLVARGSITGGSRSAQLGGTNVWRAAGTVLERARALAAQLLEADPADVVLEDGRFHVAGTPSIGRTWAEVAAAATELDGEPLAALGDFTQTTGTYPSGAHLAVVEVDTETGQVVLRRLVAVDDAGTILNPMIAEGQVHGGLAQGVAQALLEEVVYDADGNPLTANFADYGVISAAELPSFETVHLASPSPANELGAKGIGESGTIGATPAVHNAVIDALSHLGVRHLDMPCTAERVWRAIHA